MLTKDKKAVTVYLEPKTLDALKKLANKEVRSVTSWIAIALERIVKEMRA